MRKPVTQESVYLNICTEDCGWKWRDWSDMKTNTLRLDCFSKLWRETDLRKRKSLHICRRHKSNWEEVARWSALLARQLWEKAALLLTNSSFTSVITLFLLCENLIIPHTRLPVFFGCSQASARFCPGSPLLFLRSWNKPPVSCSINSLLSLGQENFPQLSAPKTPTHTGLEIRKPGCKYWFICSYFIISPTAWNQFCLICGW